MRTGSGRTKIIFFSNAVIDELESYSESTNRSVSWHVRQACFEYLQRNGIAIPNFQNPEGRGARSDLKRLPRDETRERLDYLLQTRKPKT